LQRPDQSAGHSCDRIGIGTARESCGRSGRFGNGCRLFADQRVFWPYARGLSKFVAGTDGKPFW